MLSWKLGKQSLVRVAGPAPQYLGGCTRRVCCKELCCLSQDGSHQGSRETLFCPWSDIAPV